MKTTVLAIITTFFFLSCEKEQTESLPHFTPATTRLLIAGKWQLVSQTHGFSGTTEVYPAGHVLEFTLHSGDSVIYRINDSVVARSAVTFSNSTGLHDGNGNATSITTSILPPVVIESFSDGRLSLVVPMTDGGAYLLRRLH